MAEQQNHQRTAILSFKEKLGYALGDAGFNFYWIIIGSTYLIFIPIFLVFQRQLRVPCFY